MVLVPSFCVLVVAASLRGEDRPADRVKQIIAHRGASAVCPENTMAAYRLAWRVGATAVEADVRTTKDGVLVSLHDAALDRTTDGRGNLGETTLAEVRRLDAGSWFDARFKAERVPTLQEILAFGRGRIDVLLDLKESSEEFAMRVAADVKAHGEPKRIIIGVRSVEQAKRFRKLLPSARQLGLIPTPDAIESFAAAGVETIRIWPKWLAKDEGLIVRVRKAKAALHLNGTTGKPDEVRELLRHGPDSLSSDDPARLVKTLRALASGASKAR